MAATKVRYELEFPRGWHPPRWSEISIMQSFCDE
jgi:hypothetical protein